MIGACVELDCPERREEHVKTRHIVQRDSKQGEPINQSIAGECAQGMQLIQTRTERPFPKRTVKAVRNVPETVATGRPRQLGKREAAAGENPANAVSE